MIDAGLISGEATPCRAASPGDGIPAWLRSEGRLGLRFVADDAGGGGTRLRGREESGCLRVRVPRVGGEVPEAVIVNTSGGLCGGDRLELRARWEAASAATVTSQAAEKIYGATLREGRLEVTRIATHLEAGEGATARWLPQETILFDGARLLRDTRIHLAAGARLLWAEALVFGRAARGESLTRGALRDTVRVWRAGRLVHADVLDLGAAPGESLAAPALGAGARASGVILASAEQGARLDARRAALAGRANLHAGASAWNGLVAVRLLSADPAVLRAGMAAALEMLLGGEPSRSALPRVWRC